MTTYSHDETYFKMLRAILEDPTVGDNRTSVQTISTHGYIAKYELESSVDIDGTLVIENFPLLTTKKVNFDAILCELLWFINGHTNIKLLEDNNVHIWADWPLKAYNKKAEDNGYPPITRSEFIERIKTDSVFAALNGELGPVYGSQWRSWERFTAPRADPDYVIPFNQPITDVKLYKTRIDQFQIMLDTVRHNPTSRRNIVTAWNPAELEEMAISGLPPCHTLWQVLVKNGKVNLMLHQRSLDSFLGAPYNIASYALLMAMIAEYAGLRPGTLIHSIADCHLYINHLDQIQEQMKRTPYESPTVLIEPDFLQYFVQKPLKSDFNFSEVKSGITLQNYEHHPYLKGEVAV